MLTLQNNPILTSYQLYILKHFFDHPLASSFFLTGGTALSAFYFAHRESKDLDLFSLEPFHMQDISQIIESLGKSLECNVVVSKSTPSYREMYLIHKEGSWAQRIDIVHEQPKRHGTVVTVDGIRVDALENIATNKILAIFGRLEGKDYIDLFTILRESSLSFRELFQLAKEKDSGLSEFYFANTVRNVRTITIWPEMKKDIDVNDVIAFYEDLSKELLMSIKPE